eukprot:181280-Hanusia_phi.AAC.4
MNEGAVRTIGAEDLGSPSRAAGSEHARASHGSSSGSHEAKNCKHQHHLRDRRRARLPCPRRSEHSDQGRPGRGRRKIQPAGSVTSSCHHPSESAFTCPLPFLPSPCLFSLLLSTFASSAGLGLSRGQSTKV